MGGSQNSPRAIPHERNLLVTGDQEMSSWDLSTDQIGGVLPTLGTTAVCGPCSARRPSHSLPPATQRRRC